jgi:hypothetical protein
MRSADAALAWGHHNCHRRSGVESLAPPRLYDDAMQGEAPKQRGYATPDFTGLGCVAPRALRSLSTISS